MLQTLFTIYRYRDKYSIDLNECMVRDLLPVEQFYVEEDVLATVNHVELLRRQHDLSHGERVRAHHHYCNTHTHSWSDLVTLEDTLEQAKYVR